MPPGSAPKHAGPGASNASLPGQARSVGAGQPHRSHDGHPVAASHTCAELAESGRSPDLQSDGEMTIAQVHMGRHGEDAGGEIQGATSPHLDEEVGHSLAAHRRGDYPDGGAFRGAQGGELVHVANSKALDDFADRRAGRRRRPRDVEATGGEALDVRQGTPDSARPSRIAPSSLFDTERPLDLRNENVGS